MSAPPTMNSAMAAFEELQRAGLRYCGEPLTSAKEAELAGS
jgi:hypothetical protein